MSFVERLSSFRGYRVYTRVHFGVLCWEVCPLSECMSSIRGFTVCKSIVSVVILL